MTESSKDQIASRVSANDGAETVFRIRKGYRNIGLVCLTFFVLVGVGSAYGMWIDAPHNRRVYLVVFVSLFWGFWSILSVWILLACWFERLTIQDGNVVQQGVIGKKTIDLPDVTEARWRPAKSGRITLRSLAEQMTLHLDNFEPHERLWLIRYFRNALPDTIQHGWDLFCYKVAMPLREHDAPTNRTPDPDEVKLTRRRWDWYFVPFTVLAAIFGIVTFWKFQQPRLLAAPLLPASLWILLRFLTPKRGLVAKRISAEPDLKRLLVFELWWLGVAIVGFVVFRLLKLPMPLGAVVATIAVIVWFGGLLWKVRQLDRVRQGRDREAADIAVQRWNDESQQSESG